MKRWVSGLLVGGGIAMSVLGEESQRLNETIVKNGNTYYDSNKKGICTQGIKEFDFKEGYKIGVKAIRFGDYSRNLEFVINDGKGRFSARYMDNGADGVSGGDCLNFNYKFRNGERLEFNATYKDKLRIVIDARIYRGNEKYSEYFKDTQEIGDIPIVGNFILRPLMVKPSIKKLVGACDKKYDEFARSLNNDEKPYVPYGEVIKALDEAENASIYSSEKERAGKVLLAIKKSLGNSFAKNKEVKVAVK